METANPSKFQQFLKKFSSDRVLMCFSSTIILFLSISFFFSIFIAGGSILWGLIFTFVFFLIALLGYITVLTKNKILALIYAGTMLVLIVLYILIFFIAIITAFSITGIALWIYTMIFNVFVIVFFLFSSLAGFFIFISDDSTWKFSNPFKKSGAATAENYNQNDFYNDIENSKATDPNDIAYV
eukprot:TRINITY_DN15869_c0_g1_i1.p1 TRINITY_DN15869_c0_g1~~TRINITY_DN15869_c0_g1_i1.p1  ORF type:complete len:184 (+),score=21.78 TRINITY_DN15869_c0_g1_i1:80-631(+)